MEVCGDSGDRGGSGGGGNGEGCGDGLVYLKKGESLIQEIVSLLEPVG